MKKISVLIALGMLMIAPWGMAQTIYDGAKLTGKDLTEGMFEFQVLDKDNNVVSKGKRLKIN